MSRLNLSILKPIDGNGQVFPSGTLTFYNAGATSVLKTVYSDSALSVSLGSTVTADGDGVFVDIFYSGDIRYVLKNSSGTIQVVKDLYGASNIQTGDLADSAVTTLKIADADVTLGKLLTLNSGYIITSNGVANSQVAPSGDVTMTNTGVFALTANSVEATNITNAIIETTKLTALANRTYKNNFASFNLVDDLPMTTATPPNVDGTGVNEVVLEQHASSTVTAWNIANPTRIVVPSTANSDGLQFTKMRLSGNVIVKLDNNPAAAGFQDFVFTIYANGNTDCWFGQPIIGQYNIYVPINSVNSYQFAFCTAWFSVAPTDYFELAGVTVAGTMTATLMRNDYGSGYGSPLATTSISAEFSV